MNQSRLESLMEAIVNILIWFGIALVAQMTIFSILGIAVPMSSNLIIGAFMTVVSLVRSYAIRRWFNAGLHRQIAALAKRILGAI